MSQLYKGTVTVSHSFTHLPVCFRPNVLGIDRQKFNVLYCGVRVSTNYRDRFQFINIKFYQSITMIHK